MQAAQSVHAAFQFASEHRLITSGWLKESNYLVVVAAPDEESLRDLAVVALQRGLRTTTVFEPDLDDALTAVAIEPGALARRICARLPLLGKGWSPG